MQNKAEGLGKKSRISITAILTIASIVLLLALIVVSALAYTWHNDLVTVSKRAKTLQAEASSVSSLTSEISDLQLENGSLQAQLENANNTIQELQAQLAGEE